MTAELLLLVTGFVGGWWASRVWTEMGIARHGIRKTWRGRRDWRK